VEVGPDKYTIKHGDITIDTVVVWDEGNWKTTIIPVKPLIVQAGDSFTIESTRSINLLEDLALKRKKARRSFDRRAYLCLPTVPR
jgi:hypothetical protein